MSKEPPCKVHLAPMGRYNYPINWKLEDSKKNRNTTTCNRLDFKTPGSWRIMRIESPETLFPSYHISAWNKKSSLEIKRVVRWSQRTRKGCWNTMVMQCYEMAGIEHYTNLSWRVLMFAFWFGKAFLSRFVSIWPPYIQQVQYGKAWEKEELEATKKKQAILYPPIILYVASTCVSSFANVTQIWVSSCWYNIVTP